MVSLNYVKADDQSLYQVGKDDDQDPGQEQIPENKLKNAAVYFLKTERKGAADNGSKENNV